MTESSKGHGLQIVNVTESHEYVLNERDLEQLLLKDDIKDLPVVVVSVAGAYRGGKSFLLNFFLRYLTSTAEARQDGSWLGEDSAPLVGFKWHSGITATTMGLLLWSEPIISTLPDGKKVAILLMDTQGTFDSRSTVRDCSTIFALSTLISSVQIYNISHNIQEDDLQNLQLFSAYGKMVRNQGAKAFQVLEFLVRDWQFPWDYEYGAAGGERLLQARLEVMPDLPQELKDLRQDIRSSFDKISCFLMPHPGFKVLSPKFTGNIADISIEFRNYLKDLVASLFGHEKLLPKMLNGEQIKARDLFNYFKTYMTMFNSKEILSPTSIMKATVEAGLLSALNEAREVYEKGMDSEAGAKQPSMLAVDLQDLHRKWLLAASTSFTTKKKMGSPNDAQKYLMKLNTELEERLPQFVQSNRAKVQDAINKATNAYEEAMQNINKGQMLCVHPLDLERIHNEGCDAATRIFDATRKIISNKKDDERAQMIESFNTRYALLRQSNEDNNKMMVSLVHMEYIQHMQTKAVRDPPLSDREFTNEHEHARSEALKEFDSKRNLPNSYSRDVYRSNLIQNITETFNSLHMINIIKIRREERKRQEEEDRKYEEERRRREEERNRIEQERRRREWENEMRRRREEESRSNCSIL